MSHHAQEGAAALLVTVLGLLLLLLTCVGIVVTTAVIDAVGVAQHTADAAAVAVLTGSPLAGGDGTPALDGATRVAEAHGMVVTDVDLDAWPLAVRIVVRPDAGRVMGPGGPLRAAVGARRGAARLVPP